MNEFAKIIAVFADCALRGTIIDFFFSANVCSIFVKVCLCKKKIIMTLKNWKNTKHLLSVFTHSCFKD